VQRVVRTWLVPEGRTVGWQIPDEQLVSSGVDMPQDEPIVAATPQVFGYTGAEVSSHGFVRTELPNGIVVLAQPRPGAQAIDGAVQIRAGHVATDDDMPGRASLTGSMLNRGTEHRSFEEYNEEVDSLGAVVGTSSSRNAIEVGWHSLIEDFDAVLDIVADII